MDGELAQPGVFAYQFFILSNMYTIEFILGDKSLDPVIGAAELADDGAGLAGDFL